MLVKEHAPKLKTAPTLKMSYEAFAEWCDENTHAEWVNGDVIVFTPPKSNHQAPLLFLWHLLTTFTSQFNLGEIRIAPFEMKLEQSNSYREPDILFIAQKSLSRLTEKRLIGPADLIIEIVSENTLKNDRQDKFKEYEAAGVADYWIIDPRPNKKRADFYTLNKQGIYVLYATEDDECVVSHILPHFWLNPAWLWEADTLNPRLIFYKIMGVPQALVDQLEATIEANWAAANQSNQTP